MPSEYDAFRSLTDALDVDPLEQTVTMTVAERRRRQAEGRAEHAAPFETLEPVPVVN